MLISDNDDVPEDSFAEVVTSLREADWRAIPQAERTVAKGHGDYPSTVILMLPPGASGSLETLCLQAAFEKWPDIQQPLDAFVQASGVGNWAANKQAKMQLACTIAATCEKRPDAGFVGHWHENTRFHIPLDHHAFDDLADFLGAFGNLVTTA